MSYLFKLIQELASDIPKGFLNFPLHHGTNYPLKKGSMYPDERKGHIYAAEDSDEASQYDDPYRIYIKDKLKTAHLYRGAKNKSALNSIKKKFDKIHPNIEKIITSGKLWRNKPLERKVQEHLFDQGYEHTIRTDEIGEDGGETTSHIIKNPNKNVYVGYN
jgi:hypothetical protein